MEYRKRNGTDTWHWCRNCSMWPAEEYIERPAKPYYGELCGECKAKEKGGVCDTVACDNGACDAKPAA